MSLSTLADRYIEKSTGKKELIHRNGNVDQIIAVILDADQKGRGFTRRFARHLKEGTDRQTLRNVWKFTKSNIKYVRDRAGDEVIKSPGATWETRKGDCKSFSVFIGSILGNLGYEYKYRVAFYDPKTPEQGHIYPIAVLKDGTEVIVDAVWDYFDSEVPYWKAYDYDPRSGTRSQLSGIGNKPVLLGLSMGWIKTLAIAGIAGWALFGKKKRK
jgi:hypothetical protein